MAEVMNDVAVKAPIDITDSAMTQLKRIMEEQNIPEGYGLRVGVKGGGCSGFTYILGFDTKKEVDQEFEISDVPVFMEKSHGMYLMGMQIDWLEGLDNRGFVFNNPNASESCGCGSSFSA
jgi:iron-sulfur cluster assembly protein